MARNRSPRTPYTKRTRDVSRCEFEEACAYILALWDTTGDIRWIGQRTGLAWKTVEALVQGVARKMSRRTYEAAKALYEEEFINGS